MFAIIAVCSIISVLIQGFAVMMAYLEFRDTRRRRDRDS